MVRCLLCVACRSVCCSLFVVRNVLFVVVCCVLRRVRCMFLVDDWSLFAGCSLFVVRCLLCDV